jgi:hypothetical protein
MMMIKDPLTSLEEVCSQICVDTIASVPRPVVDKLVKGLRFNTTVEREVQFETFVLGLGFRVLPDVLSVETRT